MLPDLKRLTMLRDFLRDDATTTRGFNMDGFFDNYHPEVEVPSNIIVEPSCGMVACMAGWACTIPAFQQAGLRAYVERRYIVPAIGDRRGFAAMEKFFGLTEDEAQYLFDNAGRSCVASVPLRRSDWQVKDAVAHLTHFIEHPDEVRAFMLNDEDYNDDDE